MNTQQQTSWFLAEICRVPLNFNSPFRLAIEASDAEHALKRLYKLYSSDAYGSWGPNRNMSDGLDRNPVTDSDLLNGAKRHPLPIL